MSTRCNIILGNTQFYHHSDGYPSGVGAELARFIANLNARNIPWEYRLFSGDTDLDEIVGAAAYHGLLTAKGFDKSYVAEPFGLHWDIEYLYIADGELGKIKLYCLDVNDYISAHSEGGSCWGKDRDNNAIWKMSIEELKHSFCKRKYLVKLPDIEVPEDQRRYLLQKTLTHSEVEDLGIMDHELNWGEDNAYGLVRTNNSRGKKPGKLRRLFSRRR